MEFGNRKNGDRPTLPRASQQNEHDVHEENVVVRRRSRAPAHGARADKAVLHDRRGGERVGRGNVGKSLALTGEGGKASEGNLYQDW